MGADLSDKRVLVLSDNDALSRALCLKLRSKLISSGITIEWGAGAEAEPRAEPDDIDLIIVAMGSAIVEPIVVLSQASLLKCVGEVPLLILSDRPFRSSPQEKILRLDLPYDVDELPYWVREMLAGDGRVEFAGGGRTMSEPLLYAEGMDPVVDNRR